MDGEGLLAHWEVDQDLWAYFAERDSKKYAKQALGLGSILSLVLLIQLVIAAADGLRWRDWGFYLGLSTAVIIVFAAGMLYPVWRRYQLLNGRRDVWIGVKGCCVGHHIYWWGDAQFGSDHAKDIELYGNGKELYLRYFEAGRSFEGDAYHSQHLIPVPRGAEEQAKGVVATLKDA